MMVTICFLGRCPRLLYRRSFGAIESSPLRGFFKQFLKVGHYFIRGGNLNVCHSSHGNFADLIKHLQAELLKNKAFWLIPRSNGRIFEANDSSTGFNN